MNIFEVVEGHSLENLASAVLRNFLIDSPVFRDNFIKCISNESTVGPVTYESHFYCGREESTDDAQRGTGRLDLVIETDDTVIGIENKFFAQLQKDQPQKYFATLEQRAVDLGKLRNKKYKSLLVVLAPQHRNKEFVLSQKGTFLSWQNAIKLLIESATESEPEAKVLLNHFAQYIKNKISFGPLVERCIPHLRRQWEPRGSDVQRSFMRKIYEFFPWPYSSFGAGNDIYGFSFATDKSEAWTGFVSPKFLGGKDDAELIVVTTFDVKWNPDNVRIIDFPRQWWRDRKHNCVILRFSESWNDPEWWNRTLKPLHEATIGLTSKNVPT